MHNDVSAASYPTLYEPLHAARVRARPHVDHRLDRRDRARRLASNLGPAARRRVQHRVRRGVAASRARSTCSTCSATSGQGQFRIFGTSNEKYHVRGGNDQIPTRLGEAARRVRSDRTRRWPSIKPHARRAVHADVQNGLRHAQRTVDHVVLALPFSILRGVNYSKAGLRAAQGNGDRGAARWAPTRSCTSSSRTASGTALGNNGDTYADTGYQNTWEVTRAQGAVTAGILVDYTGGKIGAELRQRHTRIAWHKQFLDADRAGVARHGAANGTARPRCDYWTAYPWTNGSYSYWKVGQYTKFSGMEKRAAGQLPLLPASTRRRTPRAT